MEKKHIYMIGTVGLVLMFVFEMVAMGYLGSHSDTPTTGSASAGGVTLQGSSVANVTIVKYEPYIIVKGNNSLAIEAVKEVLVAEGVASYATQSRDGLIVSLKSSKSAPEAAALFTGVNATVLATAYVNMPSTIRVTGDGVTTDAEGTSFSTQLKPVYPEGSVHEASFLVAVTDGKVTGLGNFAILPSTFANVSVVAALEPNIVSTYSVEVPWEYRAQGKTIASLATNATYKERSYIIIPEGTDSATLSTISKLPFITGTQSGVASVRNDFADRNLTAQQFALLGVAPEFPTSTATFAGIMANESAHALATALWEVNATAEVTSQSNVRAKLPPYIEAGGSKYATGGKVLLFNAMNLPGNITNVTLFVDFTAENGKLVSVSDARLG